MTQTTVGDVEPRMSERVEAVVTQVLEPGERAGYAIPPKIDKALEDNEDLVMALRDPFDPRIRSVLDLPAIGLLISFLWRFLTVIPGVEPLHEMQGSICLAADHGSISVDERIDVEVEEAVVDETISRGEVIDREVHLHEIVDGFRLGERSS